jgi:hypothetical protein
MAYKKEYRKYSRVLSEIHNMAYTAPFAKKIKKIKRKGKLSIISS